MSTSDCRLVLVVDDDQDLREMLALVLQGHGYRTQEAVDGVDALEQIEAGAQPSLVLLDLRMPRMNGTELLLALKDRERTTIPVVVITGDLGGAREALAAGARTCVRKPIDMDALLDTVAQHAS
ncbi:MAG TPA: response regulator [Kofleriaceae bacterium]|nr:response regulator [Kofleriaceae bacterium]